MSGMSGDMVFAAMVATSLANAGQSGIADKPAQEVLAWEEQGRSAALEAIHQIRSGIAPDDLLLCLVTMDPRGRPGFAVGFLRQVQASLAQKVAA